MKLRNTVASKTVRAAPLLQTAIPTTVLHSTLEHWHGSHYVTMCVMVVAVGASVQPVQVGNYVLVFRAAYGVRLVIRCCGLVFARGVAIVRPSAYRQHLD